MSDTNILVFDNAENGELLIMEYCLCGKVTFDDFQHYNKSPQKKLFIKKTSIIVNLFFYLSIAILVYMDNAKCV